MSNVQSLRWGRIALGGFLIEVVLMIAVLPLQALDAGADAITALAVGGSFFVSLAIAAWLCKTLGRPALQGALMGLVAAAIYLVMQAAATAFAPNPPEIPLIYYFAHLVKVVGGAVGGWWVSRRVTAPAA